MAIVIEICWIILDITKKITKKIKMLKLLKGQRIIRFTSYRLLK